MHTKFEVYTIPQMICKRGYRMKKHVYIIGSKGIPAKYGGFETFVDKLTEYRESDSIQYHVACMKDNSVKSNITTRKFVHNNAECFNISVPSIGPGKAIYYDVAALNYAIKSAKLNKDIEPIFYVLACRIGPFIGKIKKKIKKINGKLFVNPDGHEWLREKWNKPTRKYWKESEKLMVKHADLLVCDSKSIEEYIIEEYKRFKPQTTYIAYGTDIIESEFNDDSVEVMKWFSQNNIKSKNYYLVVGRFVPENNYETMIREFMRTDSKKDLVFITDIKHNKFYEKLKKITRFDMDQRIKFVGTVYNQSLLKYIREKAFAYIHGHEVGGTNPSLLEALFSTQTNLLLDVSFNKEVGVNEALYWGKNEGELANLIRDLESSHYNSRIFKPKNIILNNYTWRAIVERYEKQFKN